MAQGRYNEPFFWHRIVGVGWGGAFGLVNMQRTGGTADPVLVLACAAASDQLSELPPPNLVEQFWSAGQVIDNALWADDTIGVRSFIMSGGSFSGQIANFDVLDRNGAHGLIIGTSAATAGTNTYSVELLIYSGGENRVSGEIGEYPQFANTGGTLLFSATRAFTVPPNIAQVFFHFDKTGFLD